MPLDLLRREDGLAGAPVVLKGDQIAIDETADIVYAGYDIDSNGRAKTVVPIGGRGLFLAKSALGAIGLALLQAATVAAQRVLIGIDTLKTVSDTNYSLAAGDLNVQVVKLTAPRTVTLLPAASYNPGQRVRVGDSSGAASTTNTVTVVVPVAAPGTTGDAINAGASAVISNPFGQVDLMSNGVNGWTLMGTAASAGSASTTTGTF